MADSISEKATSVFGKAKEAVIASAETANTGVKDTVDNVVGRGVDGVKSLLHGVEEKKGEVSSTITETVSHVIGSTDSSASTAVTRDLPISTTDNQEPLLSTGDRGIIVEQKTPWWKNCCGVFELLKKKCSSSSK